MMVGAMVMTTVPMVSLATTSTAYAAKGGAKLGGGSVKAPAAAPKASAASPISDSISCTLSGLLTSSCPGWSGACSEAT